MSFNPCFCGTRARTALPAILTSLTLNGFNPCFCGTRARTQRVQLRGLQNDMFQSLFLWNSRPDSTRAARIPAFSAVSILVFVELAPGQGTGVIVGHDRIVSILVFVELAPGLPCPRVWVHT